LHSFEVVAREWFVKNKPVWTKKHAQTIISRLENNIFPWLGKTEVFDISAPMLLETLRRIEDRGAIETAHRVKQICGQIFRYAIATGKAERDPTADLKGALPPTRAKSMATITDPKKIGDHGLRVYFTTMDTLIKKLKEGSSRQKAYLNSSLVVVDEVGYLPVTPQEAHLFFQFISYRYERSSTIITSNKSFGDWQELFGDPVIATAILDRLLHHCKVVNIKGHSYRLREHSISKQIFKEQEQKQQADQTILQSQ